MDQSNIGMFGPYRGYGRLSQVRKEYATERIAQELERRISSSIYPDGGRLPPERDLAIEFGASRSSVRKALKKIQAQGMVWRHVGKGTFVGRAPDFYEDLERRSGISATPREIFEARLGIEPLVAGSAALSASRRDLDSLWNSVEQLENACDWSEFEIWDRSFHRSVAVATQNLVFLSILETINSLRQSELWTRVTLPDLNSRTQRENTAMHRRIVEAVARQDMHGAAREMRMHLDMVRKMYLEVPILLENDTLQLAT